MWAAIIDFLLGLIGLSRKSAQERLGVQETIAEAQAEALREVQESEKIDNSDITASERMQLGKYQRPGK